MSDDQLDRLKSALADRYAIERELGEGGMATVYLARDLRHRRQVALKVMHPELASSLGSERFLREIEIVAGLSHPHILPLFDSGEADGFLFFVMPYVEGESLRSRLEREVQLPLEEALQIAREVADALSYAHGRGVLHRDIKPENILLESGHAMVADFGIARAVDAAGGDRLTETGIAVGTPVYMSPEQATVGPEPDARTDVYSLGCVLFEMLIGEPPFTGRTAQVIIARHRSEPIPRLRNVRDTVPEAIEQAVHKALAKVPADRFASAAQFKEALAPTALVTPESGMSRRLRRAVKSPAIWLLGAALLAMAAGAVVLYPSTKIHFDTRDWILISDLENETGDSLFDGALNSALNVGIEQSQYVNVFPRSRVAETLKRMGREDVDGLTESLGREVALRNNIRVLVVPSISRVDSLYMITIRIVDPTDGKNLKSRSDRATGKAEVLASLDKLARRLRRDLGESLDAVRELGVRLDHATTPSLEALRAWSDGNKHWNEGRYNPAGVLWNRAVELDSGFAMAHKSLGYYYYWWGEDRPRSDLHFETALSLLDRVTERERLLIQAAVYGYRDDREAEINTLQIYLDRYPDDLVQRYNLGSAYMRAARYEEAISTLEKVIEFDSTHVSAHINLATSLNLLGKNSEALPYYLRAFELRPEWIVNGNLNHEFGFNYVGMGDLEAAEQTFQRMLSESPGQQARGHRSLALLRTYTGKYADASHHFERAILLDHTAGSTLSEFRDRLYLAETLQTKGARADARRELAAALRMADTVHIEPFWLRIPAKLLARAGALAEASGLRELVAARTDPKNRQDKAALSLVDGELALARGEHAEAIRQLEISYALTPERNYFLESLAYAHLVAGDLAAAQTRYEELLARRQLAAEDQEYWILAHYRLGRIHEEQGDTAKAIEYYRRFSDIWAEGDEDLPALQDTRKRLGDLEQAS